MKSFLISTLITLFIMFCFVLPANAGYLENDARVCLDLTQDAKRVQGMRNVGFTQKEINQIFLIQHQDIQEVNVLVSVARFVFDEWDDDDSSKKVEKEFFMRCIEVNF